MDDIVMQHRHPVKSPSLRGIAVALAGALALSALVLLGSPASSGAEVLEAQLRAIFTTAPGPAFGMDVAREPELRRFYERRSYKPAWTEDMRTAAYRALTSVGDHGLDPDTYGLEELRKPWPRDVPAAARRDALLTHVFLRYMRDLRLGRTSPAEVFRDAEWPRDDYDAPAALEVALSRNDIAGLVAGLPPKEPDYGRLMTALVRYRALAESGGWPTLPGGPTFDVTVHDGRRAALARRLAIEDEQLGTGEDVDDGTLDQALRRFQRRNGLDPDGRVGARTLAALNVPAVARVGQIRANLERRRWSPRGVERRRIIVNAAAAELQAFDGDDVVVTSKVIVGDRRHPTPLLRAVVTGITVNPPWNVPPSIARNEILPRLRRDSGYLRAEDMVLVNGPAGDPYGASVDWRSISAARLPYRFRQQPGPKNALGVLKLELPNRFNVYLHDTPAKALFARDDRALSHGCIRVERILPLAAYALGRPDESGSTLATEIAEGVTRTIPLAHPVPVALVYWTAFAEADGGVAFRDDFYGRDQALLARLDADRGSGKATVAAVGCNTRRGAG